MLKRISFFLYIIFCVAFLGKSQCPKFYDKLGDLYDTPTYVNCDKSNYAVNIRPNKDTGPFSINWGDGSPLTTGSNIAANDFVAHSYASTLATYTITITFPGNTGCNRTFNVINQEAANASIKVPDGGVVRVCAPGDMEFRNESTGNSPSTVYNWSFGDGTTLGPLKGDASYGKTITHTYQANTVNCETTVTLTALNECNTQASVNKFFPVQIWDTDIPNISTSYRVLCWPNNQITFANTTLRNCATPAEGNTGQRYEKWVFKDFFGPGLDSIIDWAPWPPTNPKTVTFKAIGKYTVELYVRNSCGETQTAVTVEIVNPPTLGISTDKDTVCIGESLTVTNTGSGGNVHLYDPGDGTPFGLYNGTSVTYTYKKAGKFTFTLQVDQSGASGCSSTISKEIVVLDSPQPSFTIDKNRGCDNVSVVVKNTSTSGTNFAWDYGDGRTSTDFEIGTISYSTPGKYPLKLTLLNARGCQGIQVDTINVYTNPTVQFSIGDTCTNYNVKLDNTPIIDPRDSIVGFSWNFGDGNTATDFLPNYTYVNFGTFTVQLTVNTKFCQQTAQQSVTILPKPVAGFYIENTVVCDSKDVVFVNTSANASIYAWDYGDGSSSANSATKHSVNYDLQNTTAQILDIQLIAQTTIGCPDTINTQIEVKPKIEAAFAAVPDACSPYDVTVQSQSFGANSLVWEFSGVNGGNLPTVTYRFVNNTINPKNEYAELRVFRVDGCTDTLRHYFNVLPKPAPDFNPSPQSQKFPATNVNFANTTGGTWSYTWDFGDASSGSNVEDPSYSYSTWGEYDVKLIAINNTSGCLDSIIKSVEILPPNPIPSFSMNTSGCRPLTVSFTENSKYVDHYKWNFGDGSVSTAKEPVHTYFELGTFDVTLTVVGFGGDVDALTMPQAVRVFRKAEAFFTVNPSSIPNIDTPVDMLNLSQFATEYEWNFGDGTYSSETDPSYFYSSPGSYDITLIANNSQNCPDTMFIAGAITVGEGGFVLFPNAFSPNPDEPGDEYYIPNDISNDIFRPQFYKVKAFKMDIFTRWGERIFRTTDINKGWNGWFNGEICQQEVYVYTAEVEYEDGRTKKYVGDITLLR